MYLCNHAKSPRTHSSRQATQFLTNGAGGSLVPPPLLSLYTPNKDDDNGEWMQLLRPNELREVLELDRARKEVERQIIHANQVHDSPRFTFFVAAVYFFDRATLAVATFGDASKKLRLYDFPPHSRDCDDFFSIPAVWVTQFRPSRKSRHACM